MSYSLEKCVSFGKETGYQVSMPGALLLDFTRSSVTHQGVRGPTTSSNGVRGLPRGSYLNVNEKSRSNRGSTAPQRGPRPHHVFEGCSGPSTRIFLKLTKQRFQAGGPPPPQGVRETIPYPLVGAYLVENAKLHLPSLVYRS